MQTFIIPSAEFVIFFVYFLQRKFLICSIGLLLLSVCFLINSLSGGEIIIQKDLPEVGLFVLINLLACLSLLFLIIKLKKIDDKIWRVVVIFGGVGFFLLNTRFGGASSLTSGLQNIFKEPVFWLLLITLISHLVFFVYKRNKPQMN